MRGLGLRLIRGERQPINTLVCVLHLLLVLPCDVVFLCRRNAFSASCVVLSTTDRCLNVVTLDVGRCGSVLCAT